MQVGPLGRDGPAFAPAVEAHCGLAASHGLAPVQLALPFVAGRPFITIAIVGATSREQLAGDFAENLDALATVLDHETPEAIDRIHLLHTTPSP